jgi:Schlafen, AlbA_2
MAQSLPELFIGKIEADPANAETLIETFVIEKRAEDLHLEFKQKHDPTKASLAETDKGRLSKAMSAFANSDGGVIVWGVVGTRGNDQEVPDVAVGLAPISNIDAFHSNLNDLISTAISTKLPGARNLKVSCRSDTSKGYIVTHVPAGEVPPYRAEFCGKQYFKRSVNTSYPMEPFDIRDLVSRGRYPKIKINAKLVPIPTRAGPDFLDFVLSIRNEGPSALESWKLVLEYSNAIVAPPIDGIRNRGQSGARFIGPDGGQWWRPEFRSVNFGDRDHTVIYPEDEILVISQATPMGVGYAFRINEASVAKTGRPINWRFYGWNIPSQEGSILLNGELVNQLTGITMYP